MNRKAAIARANQRVREKLSTLRSCGQCRACCITMPVLELGKGADVACQHLQAPPAKGCAIYEDRPQGCREWKCVWLGEPNTLTGEERPDRLGAIFDAKDSDMGFPIVLCREVFPDAFERSEVKAVIQRLVNSGNLVLLISGDEGSVVVHDALGPRDKVDAYDQHYRGVA